ncbi:MAG: helix-turn-helix domain-containing protein [Mycobacteriaceae bacterium]|nr:helix-turn-helix domain-containing protein [Mycobacteriaceae bacterium]
MTDSSITSVTPPSLAALLRSTRTRAGLPREQVARAASVSVSYLAQLENGEKSRPSAEMLRALATALGMDATTLCYAFALAGVDDGSGGPVDEADPITADMRATLEHFGPTMAAYMNSATDLLAGNRSYFDALPGLRIDGNLLHWMFTSAAARRAFADWRSEATYIVAMFRSVVAAFPERSERVQQLLDSLADSPDFVDVWNGGHVTYARREPLLGLRRPDTGEIVTVDAQFYRVPHAVADVYVFIGIPVPDEQGRPGHLGDTGQW